MIVVSISLLPSPNGLSHSEMQLQINIHPGTPNPALMGQLLIQQKQLWENIFSWPRFGQKIRSFRPIPRENQVIQGFSRFWLTQTNMLFFANWKLLSLQDFCLELKHFILHSSYVSKPTEDPKVWSTQNMALLRMWAHLKKYEKQVRKQLQSPLPGPLLTASTSSSGTLTLLSKQARQIHQYSGKSQRAGVSFILDDHYWQDFSAYQPGTGPNPAR